MTEEIEVLTVDELIDRMCLSLRRIQEAERAARLGEDELVTDESLALARRFSS